jgi:hypothetical protein
VRLRERLLEIARFEAKPRVMPHVLREWGLDVPEHLGAGAEVGRIPPEPELALLDEAGPIGGMRALRIRGLDTLWQRQAQAAFAWGIFNPFSPTITMIGVMRSREGGRPLLWYGLLNPFKIGFRIIGLCEDPGLAGWASADAIIQSVFSRNEIVDTEGERWPVVDALPDFVIAHEEPDRLAFVRRLFVQSPTVVGADIEDRLSLIEAHRNPWDRTGVVRSLNSGTHFL